MLRTYSQTYRVRGCTAIEERRVSWEIYTDLKKQHLAVQAMLQMVCSHLSNKMHRLCPDVSTGFCGLHHVRPTYTSHT